MTKTRKFLDNRYKETKQWHIVFFVAATLLLIWVLYDVSSRTPVVVIKVENTITSTSTTHTVEVLEVKKEVSLEDKIRHYFPRNAETMIAVAKAESGMRMNAQGFNCFYNKDRTIVYETRVPGSHSAHCKKGHEKFAWSTDCFLLQKNYIGKVCPQGVTLDQHLEEVANLSRVQGLEAWSSFNNGSYKKHLANN